MKALRVFPFALASFLACAHRSQFPSLEALEKLAAKPPPAEVFKSKRVSVEKWELSGPLATHVALSPRSGSTPWEGLLAQLAQSRAGALTPSEDMHCVAREVGRFALEHGSQPSADLHNFIEGRCGASVVRVWTNWIHGEVPEDVSDEKVFERWKGDLEKQLREELVGNRAAGVWFGRKGGRAVVAFASGERKALIEPMELAAEGGAVTLRGELFIKAEKVRALANRGRYGFSECEVDSKVVLPRFSVRCQVAPEDEVAWVQVTAFPPGRILGELVAEVLALPGGSGPKEYLRVPYTAPLMAKDVGDFSPELLTLVNQVRAQAGLGQLRLSAKQSETAARLAPHYFSAVFGQAEEMVADTVVMGLRAGWNVGGPVLFGTFTSSWVMSGGDVSAVVGDMLAHPWGREALLDSKVTEVAFGPIVDSARGALGVVVSGYALMDERRHPERVKEVVDLINERRAEKGMAPALWVSAPGDSAERTVALMKDGEDPDGALTFLMRECGRVLNRRVSGWILTTHSLEELQIPEELLQRQQLGIIAVVGQHKERAEPWTNYVVLLVLTDVGPTQTASASAPRTCECQAEMKVSMAAPSP
ncbi:MAG: hypothetical protein HYZ28_19395 [Myxococcales bacterium]|nr:hypothetical protein [Myxococcales bacterium]